MIPASRSVIALACTLLTSLTLAVIPSVAASAGGTTATPAVVRQFLITRGVPSRGTLASPTISGNLVVWLQATNRGGIAMGDIYGKNLATGRMFSVTTGRSVLSNPAISDATVVWLACRSCSMTRDAMGYITYHKARVYAKDLSTGQTRRIVTLTNAQPPFPPTIRGRIVLWWEISHGRYTEYGQDLMTGRVFPLIHPAQCGRHTALLNANTVVWLNTRAGQLRLCGTDLRTGRTFPIVISRSTLRHARDVKASNRIVIWTDWDANRARQPASIYGKDLTTGREFHVTTLPYGRFNPQLGPPTAVSDRLVLWEASPTAPFTGANAHLYGYDIATGQTFQIAGASYVQQSLAVSGTMVAWLDYRAGTFSIYGAHVTLP